MRYNPFGNRYFWIVGVIGVFLVMALLGGFMYSKNLSSKIDGIKIDQNDAGLEMAFDQMAKKRQGIVTGNESIGDRRTKFKIVYADIEICERAYSVLAAVDQGTTREKFDQEVVIYSDKINLPPEEDFTAGEKCLFYVVSTADVEMSELVPKYMSHERAVWLGNQIKEGSTKILGEAGLIEAIAPALGALGRCLESGAYITEPSGGEVMCEGDDLWPEIEADGNTWGGCPFVVNRDAWEQYEQSFDNNIELYKFCVTAKVGSVIICQNTNGCSIR